MARFLIICGGTGQGLLGQADLLKFHGELQLDVVGENTRTQEDFTEFKANYEAVNLDNYVGTGRRLFSDLYDQIDEYEAQPSKNLITFLQENYVGDDPLKDGLSQNPTIGGATIRHPQNELELDANISRLVTQTQAFEGDTEFWIISSTAGGTGEGIHRFVAERIIKFYAETEPDTTVRLIFVRIGPRTFQSVNSKGINTNTFFGIAMDSALSLRMKEKYEKASAVVRWIYLDLPDVGIGEDARGIRKNMVEMACKTLMLEELQVPLNAVLSNTGQAIFRTGFWGEDFEKKQIYYSTLNSLRAKLKTFISPSFDIPASSLPNFVINDLTEKVDFAKRGNNLLQAFEADGWRFLRDKNLKLQDYDRVLEQVGKYEAHLDILLGSDWADTMITPPHFEIQEKQKQTGASIWVTLDSGDAIGEDQDIFDAIDNAHQVIAWCEHALGTNTGTSWTRGYIQHWLSLVDQCVDAQYGGFFSGDPQKRSQDLALILPEFIEYLVRIKLLITSKDRAERLLSTALNPPKRLLEQVEVEFTAFGEDYRNQPSQIITADLHARMGGVRNLTWLDTLLRVLDKAVIDPVLFEREVMRGAIGLSDIGLRKVLGAKDNADAHEINQLLVSQVGRMKDQLGNEYQGLWWGGRRPAGIFKEYDYRVLPKLDRKFELQLGDGYKGVTYTYTQDVGIVGLNILAIQAVCIATRGDTVRTPEYLMQPYATQVKTFLKDWEHVTGQPSGKYEIALRGNIGEPLHKTILERLKFTDEELEKLGELFMLFDPGDKKDEFLLSEIEVAEQGTAEDSSEEE